CWKASSSKTAALYGSCSWLRCMPSGSGRKHWWFPPGCSPSRGLPMPDVMTRTSQLTDRLSNRLIWKMATKTRTVDTDVPLVTFTFDDVPDTALTHGATILERHGAKGTFYIAGSLGGQVEPDRTLISPEGCRELARRGHEIGCHTFAHRRIRTFGRSLADDLDHSRHYLSECGVEQMPRNFAFPYNAAWPLARRILKRRYLTCRGAGEAINR